MEVTTNFIPAGTTAEDVYTVCVEVKLTLGEFDSLIKRITNAGSDSTANPKQTLKGNLSAKWIYGDSPRHQYIHELTFGVEVKRESALTLFSELGERYVICTVNQFSKKPKWWNEDIGLEVKTASEKYVDCSIKDFMPSSSLVEGTNEILEYTNDFRRMNYSLASKGRRTYCRGNFELLLDEWLPSEGGWQLFVDSHLKGEDEEDRNFVLLRFIALYSNVHNEKKEVSDRTELTRLANIIGGEEELAKAAIRSHIFIEWSRKSAPNTFN